MSRIDELFDERDDATTFGDEIGLAGEALADAPPAALRARVIAALSPRSPRRPTPAGPVEALATTIDDVAALLASLSPGDWATPGALDDLDVKQTVAHLHGADVYLGAKVGAWEAPLPADEQDHRATSQAHIDRCASMDAGDVLDAWDEWSGRLVAHLRGLPAQALGEPAKYNIIEGPLGAVLVARAFELWTHAEDICRATARPPMAPRPEVLAAMTDVGSALVPVGYGMLHGESRANVRLVLTGEGGGRWDLALGSSGAAPTTVITSDAVDFCRMIANRIHPTQLDCEIEGDRALGERVLVGATLFAMD